MDTIVVNYIGREKRYAVLKGKAIQKMVIEQPQRTSLVGSIYIGTVTKILSGLQAAFVEIGENKQGFIHRDKLASYYTSTLPNKDQKSIGSFLHQGQKVIVQVEKDATNDKGPRLTSLLELGGQYCVFLPYSNIVSISRKIEDVDERDRLRQWGERNTSDHEGLILRTSCFGVEENTLLEEVTKLRTLYQGYLNESKQTKKPTQLYSFNYFLQQLQEDLDKRLPAQLIVDDSSLKASLRTSDGTAMTFHQSNSNIFQSFGIEVEIANALKRTVVLEGGATLVIDETEAMTIIDVNTAKFQGKNHLRDTVVKTNERAADEIVRQIQLRDLAGMILIDFIDMKHEQDRQAIVTRFARMFRNDHRARVIGFTELGILQITRQKTKISLSEQLQQRCSSCGGTGKVDAPEALAFRLERELWELRGRDIDLVHIEATSDVVDVFCGENHVHKERVESQTGFRLRFDIMPSSKPYYRIGKLN